LRQELSRLEPNVVQHGIVWALFAIALATSCSQPLPIRDPQVQRDLDRANAAARAGNYASARTQLEALVENHPADPTIQLELARAIARTAGTDALQQHAAMLAEKPMTRAVGLLLLAEHATPELAETLLREAIDIAPTWHAARIALARRLRLTHRYPEAIAELEQVLAVDADAYEARIELAWCLAHTFHWPNALAQARIALAIDPQRARAAHIFLAIDRMIRRDPPGAIEQFRILFDNDVALPGDAMNVASMAYRAALQQLRDDHATTPGLALARDAVVRFPRSATFHGHLGWFLAQTGDSAGARQALERANRIDPYDMHVIQDLRRLRFADGDYAAGHALWRKMIPQALIDRPDNQVAHRYRALVAALDAAPRRDGASAAALLALGNALRGWGWLEEAVLVFNAAGMDGAADQEETTHVCQFLKQLKQRLHAHYHDVERGGSSFDLDRLTKWVASHWPLQQTPVDLHEDLARYFVVVREATPFQRQSGSLSSALDRYNLAFDVGDNAGHLDFRLAQVLFRARAQQDVGGLSFSYTALLIDETLVDNYSAHLAGRSRISGRAFLSRRGFYVAVDTLRPGQDALRRFLAGPRTYSAPPTRAQFEYDRSLDHQLRQRFFARWQIPYPVLQPSTEQLDKAFQAYLTSQIHNVWMHELGHVVDFDKYLPLGERFTNNLLVTVGCGLSPARIVRRFERVAETFALATTPYPYLCLQDNLARLALDIGSLYYLVLVAWNKRDPRESPYYLGAQQILAQISDNLPPTLSIADLSEDAIRQQARVHLIRAGFPFEPEPMTSFTKHDNTRPTAIVDSQPSRTHDETTR
jgi:tetratricopeptide (TPR) repeat protein